MFCKKCAGRVFVDSVFSENNHVELFCIRCGKRWMISKEKGVFGSWLTSVARNMM
jgi:hypothetical protein